MGYLIERAAQRDMERIRQIYAGARIFMADHGNASQWGSTYPEDSLIARDIARGNLYTVRDQAGIHGVFYFAMEEDPTYRVIRDGGWRSDTPYGVIHRIAGDGSGGILKAAADYAASQIPHLRIDTHENNLVMQNALRKHGFRKCGTIFLEDGSSRIAYERTDGIREAQYADLEQLLTLYCHLHETKLPARDDRLLNTWKRILQDADHHVIVYEYGGRIVSSCTCVIIPNLTRNVRPYGLIENVVTHEAFRGRGYASACLDYARRTAVQNNCYKLMLLTGAKDKQTHSFYQKAGFNSVDKTAFVQWLDG